MGRGQLSRRTVLRSFGAAGLGAASAGVLGSCGQRPATGPHGIARGGVGEALQKMPGELTVVSANPISGEYSKAGILITQGERLAITETPNVAGMQVGHLPLDTHEDPEQAARKVRDALAGGSTFVTGGLLPEVAAALSEVVDAHGGVFTTSGSTAEDARCHAGTFHWTVPAYGVIDRTVPPLLTRTGARRWYTITPDSAIGKSLLSETKRQLSAHGAQHIGNSFHSPETTSFTEYLNHAANAQPDMLLVLSSGPHATHLLKEAAPLHLTKRMEICVARSSGASQVQGLAPKLLEGVYMGAEYWHATGGRANREFVAEAIKQLGRPPGDHTAAGYACAKLILDGIEQASRPEPAEVISVLEGFEYQGLTGQEKVRSADHQVIKNYYLLHGRSEDGEADWKSPLDVVSYGRSFRPPSTSCS